MNEKEQLIKHIEKVKEAVREADRKLSEVNTYLSRYDNVSIDELPKELQDDIIGLIQTRNILNHAKLTAEKEVMKTELLLMIGEQF